MSSSTPNSTAGGTDALPPAVLDLILNGYADGIRSSLGFVLVFTIFSSFLIPMLIILFYFSTPTSRKRPIFILNVLALASGIGVGGWGDYLLVSNSTPYKKENAQ